MRRSEGMATTCHSCSIQNDAFRPEGSDIQSWIQGYGSKIVVKDYPGLRHFHPAPVPFCHKEMDLRTEQKKSDRRLGGNLEFRVRGK